MTSDALLRVIQAAIRLTQVPTTPPRPTPTAVTSPAASAATSSSSATVAIAVACLAVAGVILTAVLNRGNANKAVAAANKAAGAADKAASAADAAAKQLDVWRKREETMRTLRWAAELALSADNDTKIRGTKILTSLTTVSSLVQPEDLGFITAVLSDVVSPARDILLSGIRREGNPL